MVGTGNCLPHCRGYPTCYRENRTRYEQDLFPFNHTTPDLETGGENSRHMRSVDSPLHFEQTLPHTANVHRTEKNLTKSTKCHGPCNPTRCQPRVSWLNCSSRNGRGRTSYPQPGYVHELSLDFKVLTSLFGCW